MYAVGAKVVHPCYGAGTVVGIQEKRIADRPQTYYVINTVVKSMQIMVPVGQAESVGLRDVDSAPRLRDSLDCHCVLPTDAEIDSDLRARQSGMQEQLKSGDFASVINVVRKLVYMSSRRPLGTIDRQLLDRGKDLLAGELALASGGDLDAARRELDSTLARMMES